MNKFPTFAQFLAEKEKMVKMYGTGSSPGMSMAKVVNPAKPNTPFSGMGVTKIFAKDGPRRASGVMG